jgi:triacylglycerol lipase
MAKAQPQSDPVAAWNSWQAAYEAASGKFEAMLAENRAELARIEKDHQAELSSIETKLDDAMKGWSDGFTKALSASQDSILQYAPIHEREAGAIPMQRAAYSDRTAALMCKLARLAYVDCTDQDKRRILDSILTRGKIRNFVPLTGEGTLGASDGFFAETDKFCVVAFRGTASRDDVRTDLQVKLNVKKIALRDEHRNVEVQVHSGFLGAYQKLETQVEKLLLAAPDKPIYLTGHSLGGAIALVASAALGNSGKPFAARIAAVYTYGAPRVGERNFSRIVKTPHYRVVNEGDAVPLVPPVWLYGYVHTGLPVLLREGADEPAHVSPRGSAFWHALRSFAMYPFTRSLLFEERHSTGLYERRLHRIAIKRSGGASSFLGEARPDAPREGYTSHPVTRAAG